MRPAHADDRGRSLFVTQAAFPFFVGRGRSGTTLLLALFDSHPEMAVAYESHFTVGMALRRRRYERRSGFDRARFIEDLIAWDGFERWRMTRDEVTAALAATLPQALPEAVRSVYTAYARGVGKSRYGEKSPGFVMHISLLAEMFPEARFVRMIRDGRDVTLSYRDLEWGPRDVEESAYYWKRFVAQGRAAGRSLGNERYREVRYEALVDDPERHIKSLCEFLDLDFEKGMLSYFERADSVLGKMEGQLWATGHQNLRRPPTKGLRDWRTQMSKVDIKTFEALAGDLLSELGYERAFPKLPLDDRADAGLRWLRVQGRRVTHRLSKAWR